MSTSPESESGKLDLDLDLQLLPAWAQRSPHENAYAKYQGGDDERPGRRRDDRPRRMDRRADKPAFRKPDASNRPREASRPRDRGPRRRDVPREPEAPRLPLSVGFIPDEKGVESLARQIRLTGRAYPLFDVASLILKRPDRYRVRISILKTPAGEAEQPLFLCQLDETLWLSEPEATEHVLTRHFATFYQAQRVPADPPKGTYTFVGQCGLSGTILGPPNYHDYQNKVRKLHAERFGHMSFEVFKARIKIVRDDAVVKKWLEEQSWRTEYTCLNVPDAATLSSREEVERHFREAHLANVVKPVEAHELLGSSALGLPCRPLQSLVRRTLDEQGRFPLRVVNVLSQQFAGHGLQFFKVNKTVTHVAVARPHFLDVETTPVSEGIRRIVDFIKSTSDCNRRKILEALVPASMASAASPEPRADAEAPSPEATAVISDLHWLIHQGHVIEFSSGLIELARKPAPRPPRPETPAAPPPEPQEGETQPGPEGATLSSPPEGTATSTDVQPQEGASMQGTDSASSGAETSSAPEGASAPSPSGQASEPGGDPIAPAQVRTP